MTKATDAQNEGLIEPPIVIADDPNGSWVGFYNSPAEVAERLEGWFATEYPYRAFDRTGVPLELYVETEARTPRFLLPRETVRVRSTGAEPRVDDLRDLLARFLQRWDQAEGITAEATFEELLRRSATYSGSRMPTGGFEYRPLTPGRGDEYLAGFPPETPVARPQRQALRELRELLDRIRPTYATPDSTRTDPGEYMDVLMVIEHANDRKSRIRIGFGDGALGIDWPGHDESIGGWDWDPELTRMVEALLTGRNRQIQQRRLGIVVSSETTLWNDDSTWVKSVAWRPLWRMPLRFIPFPRSRRERSISFSRANAIESAEPRWSLRRS